MSGVQSDGKAVTTGDVPMYLNTSGLLVGSSGKSMASKLNIDGSNAMTGDLNTMNIVSGNVRPRDDASFDLGSASKRYRSCYLSGNLEGDTLSTPIDNIVSNSGGSATMGNLPVFRSGTGRDLIDSSVPIAEVVLNPAMASVAGNVSVFADTSGVVVEDTGVVSTDLVTNVGAASAALNVSAFADTSGKVLQDTGYSSSVVSRCPYRQGGGPTVTGLTESTLLYAPAVFLANSLVDTSIIKFVSWFAIITGKVPADVTFRLNIDGVEAWKQSVGALVAPGSTVWCKLELDAIVEGSLVVSKASLVVSGWPAVVNTSFITGFDITADNKFDFTAQGSTADEANSETIGLAYFEVS